MPLRQRLRKAFTSTRTSSTSSARTLVDETPTDPSLIKTTSSGHRIEYYAADQMPKPKYRGRVDQAHQDKLSAFTFSFGSSEDEDSPRRNGSHSSSAYSPAQSRRGSLAAGGVSRKGSRRESNLDEPLAPSRIGQPPMLLENSDSVDDVRNVGMYPKTAANATDLETHRTTSTASTVSSSANTNTALTHHDTASSASTASTVPTEPEVGDEAPIKVDDLVKKLSTLQS